MTLAFHHLAIQCADHQITRNVPEPSLMIASVALRRPIVVAETDQMSPITVCSSPEVSSAMGRTSE